MKTAQMAIKTLQYRYSLAEPITKSTQTTLFSNEYRRLVQNLKKYQIYDETTSKSLNEGDFSEVSAQITRFSDTGVIEAEQYNFDNVMKWIKRASQKSLLIYGYYQQTTDKWKVLDDNLLQELVGHLGTHFSEFVRDDLIEIDSHDGRTYKVNNNYQKLFQHDDKFNKTQAEVLYKLCQLDGQEVITDIPLAKLPLVIAGYLHGISQTEIGQLFLTPSVKNCLADAELVYELTDISQAKLITTVTDLESLDKQTLKLPFVEDSGSLQFYLGTEEVGDSISNTNIKTELSAIYHGTEVSFEPAVKAFSDELLDLIEQKNWLVFRQQRCLQVSPSQLVDNVFILKDRVSQKVIVRDLSLMKLLKYIFE